MKSIVTNVNKRPINKLYRILCNKFEKRTKFEITVAQ